MNKFSWCVLSIVILLSACSKPKSFDYRGVKNIKVQQIGFDKSKLSMELVYFNPNNFGVRLDRKSVV